MLFFLIQRSSIFPFFGILVIRPWVIPLVIWVISVSYDPLPLPLQCPPMPCLFNVALIKRMWNTIKKWCSFAPRWWVSLHLLSQMIANWPPQDLWPIRFRGRVPFGTVFSSLRTWLPVLHTLRSARLLWRTPPSDINRGRAYFFGGQNMELWQSRSCSRCTYRGWFEWKRISPAVVLERNCTWCI